MSISTNTKSQQSNIFNPSDYIDEDYMSRAEADIRFLNQNVAYEKMFGSLDITGDSTMTNQLVTGNSTINGELRAGVANNELKNTYIYGNVTLGDQLSTNPTKVYMLGENIIGLTKPTRINGQVLINNDDTWGSDTVIGKSNKNLTINSNITKIDGTTDVKINNDTGGNTIIGNGLNSTTLNGSFSVNSGSNNISMTGSTIGLNSTGTSVTTCNIGKSNNNTTNIPGTVNIGSTTKITAIDAGTLNLNISGTSGATTIGNGIGQVNINTKDVILGNDDLNSVTQIKGRTIAIGNTPPPVGVSSGIQIGAGGLVADAVNGQTNTLVSTVNKIFNPKICDAFGTIVPTRNFNLNNPSFFVYSQNTTQVNNTYAIPPCSTVTNVVFYLYTPSLIDTYTYAFSFEFYYYMMTGRINATTNLLTPASAAKVINSSFSIILSKAIGDTTYAFKSYALYENISPFVSYSSSAGSSGYFPGLSGSCNPLGFAKGGSDGRITITIQFPQMVQTSTSTVSDFVCSRGASLRLCGSSMSSGTQQVYPNNAMDSFGGTSFFQLS